MKLGKYAAALVVTSFLLTGCGNSKTVKEDGKYVVASLSKDKKDKNIFADDIFEDITNTTFLLLTNQIVVKLVFFLFFLKNFLMTNSLLMMTWKQMLKEQ